MFVASSLWLQMHKSPGGALHAVPAASPRSETFSEDELLVPTEAGTEPTLSHDPLEDIVSM